jgi:hypothetical protein
MDIGVIVVEPPNEKHKSDSVITRRCLICNATGTCQTCKGSGELVIGSK